MENEFDRVINGDFSMWKEAVGLWMKQLEGIKKCAICGFFVHDKNFPEDYPDEWKFCCSCLGWAEAIALDRNSWWVVDSLKHSPTVKKIFGKITLAE